VKPSLVVEVEGVVVDEELQEGLVGATIICSKDDSLSKSHISPTSQVTITCSSMVSLFFFSSASSSRVE
jgi:hypothetical protein